MVTVPPVKLLHVPPGYAISFIEKTILRHPPVIYLAQQIQNMITGAIDRQGRCSHYHSDRDIVAIKFKCCQQWYACICCHKEATDHMPTVWLKEEFNTEAVLCGHCNTPLSIAAYFASGNQCPSCGAGFNPKCANHYQYYFEV